MDMKCPICNEPWENDTFHEEAEVQRTTYKALFHKFTREGCRVFIGAQCSSGNRSALATAVYDLAGDDTDFAMSMFEDAELLGFDF